MTESRKALACFCRRAAKSKDRRMKKIIFSMICFCACLPMLAAVVFVDNDYDVQFVNKNTEEFTGLVGQVVTRTGLVQFADAEIPPDPNPPVDRNQVGINLNESLEVYSLQLTGDDALQFTAQILWRSFTSNKCTVLVTYRPNTLGTHTAILWLHCTNAGVPTVKIPLHGEAIGVLGDLTGDSVLDIRDVSGMVNKLLMGEKDDPAADVNSDGQFTITDVSSLINRLLTGE